MECDDNIPGDISTQVEIELGETFSETLQDCDDFDTDYIRVKLQYGKLYDFDTNFRGFQGYRPTQIGLRNAQDLFTPFRAVYSGVHYVRVRSSPQDYRFSIYEVPSDGVEQNFHGMYFPLGYAAIEELTDSHRRHVFQFETIPGKEYILNAIGVDGGLGTLPDPWIGVGDNTDQWYNNNGGKGRDAFLRFVANKHVAWATAGGTGNGEYRVYIRKADEVPSGPGTRVPIPQHNRVTQYIETRNDIDWFRVPMESGQWYRFETYETESPQHTFLLRDPSLNVRATQLPTVDQSIHNKLLNFDYRADATGDHFMIARSGVSSPAMDPYTIKYARITPPTEDTLSFFETSSSTSLVGTRRFLLEDGEELGISELFSVTAGEVETYEVLSQKGLYRDGVAQAENVIHEVPASEIGRWTHSLDEDNSRTDIYVRASVGGTWTRWDRTPVYHRTTNLGLISDSTWELEEGELLTWGVPTSLPSHFEDTYSDFLSIQDRVIEFGDFTDSQTRGLLEHTNDAPDINIFISGDVDGYVDAYAPGDGAGGDIVLAFEFYGPDKPLIPGSREHFELLRGLGVALGLQESDQSTLRQSVFSSEMPDDENRPFTFMPHDERALETIYERELFPFAAVNEEIAEQATGFGQRTGSFGDGKISSIDVSEGGRIQYHDRNVTGYGGENAEFSRYIGRSTYNANIIGNDADNELSYLGVGWIDGRGGDDELYGGGGTNFYGYQFGHGDDTIVDNQYDRVPTPANDTLRLMGFNDFNISLDRLQFTRVDNIEHYLSEEPVHLRIDLLNDQGNSEGSVTIDEQADPLNRIESVQIFNDGKQDARFNLVNLFNQLAPDETSKFKLVDGGNGWGSFVSPS